LDFANSHGICGEARPFPIKWLKRAAATLAAGALLVFLVDAVLAYRLIGRGNRRAAEVLDSVPHESAVVRPDQLTGSGRIYLVQMGPHTAAYAIADFAQWLRSKYGLHVEILPETTIVPSAWDNSRGQYIAELLYDQIKREHPNLAEDPEAYLIGFTDADMYAVQYDWRFSYSQRDMKRAAVISSARLRDTFWERIGIPDETANAHLQARLRRFLLKDIAVLYWHLPLNNDPTSLLHQTLYPDLPLEDIYETDLGPDRTAWGRYEGEPCIFFVYSKKEGLHPLKKPLIGTCADVVEDLHDETQEVFEVDLRLGMLIDRHTDFYLPGKVPIQLERATRDGWSSGMGFGLSGNHNYDTFLASADMRQISVVHSDGGRTTLRRTPGWLPILPLVKYVDEDSGKFFQMNWRTTPFEHFELRRFDGEIKRFLPCNGSTVYCYLVGYRSAQGDELVFERDQSRKLKQVTMSKNWVQLHYGPENRIAEIVDSRGRKVEYSYDKRGRLEQVTYPSGEAFHYEYDDTQHLLTFSVAPDGISTPRVLLRNEYEQGKIVKQTFANGEVYEYSYTPVDSVPVHAASVRTPDDRVFDLSIDESDSAIRERDKN
jgi:YD repeat-containing protein